MNWKPIDNCQGYMISDTGLVKSCSRKIEAKNKSGWKISERILTPLKHVHGYLFVDMSLNNKIHTSLVARLVAHAFIPNPENKPTVNHINGIKTDNRTSNLEWATHSENMQHSYDTGLRLRPNGANAGRATLNKGTVLEIRRRYAQGEKQQSLADEFGIVHQTIYSIVNRLTWKHVN